MRRGEGIEKKGREEEEERGGGQRGEKEEQKGEGGEGDFKWGMCVCVWEGERGRERGGREVVDLLSNLVLLISVAQVSAQCLHPVSRATCKFSECIGMYM